MIENLNYKNLKLKRPALLPVTEEEVNEEAERFRLSLSKVEEITDPSRVLKNGDTAHIDFTGYVDGKKFEGGEAKCYDLVIGSHSFIDGFEDQMVGMHVGEEKDLNVAFPANYPAENLAGKPAVFHVVLHAVKEKKEVALTDELVKNNSRFQTVDEFKNAYREYLTDKKMEDFVAEKNDLVLNEIVKNAKIEVTKDMIDAEVNKMLKDLEENLKSHGLTMTAEEFFKANGSSLEAETERVRERVKDNVKKVLVIESIMEKEFLTASDDEVEEFLKQSNAPKETVDKEGVKLQLSYAKVFSYLDQVTTWEDESEK